MKLSFSRLAFIIDEGVRERERERERERGVDCWEMLIGVVGRGCLTDHNQYGILYRLEDALLYNQAMLIECHVSTFRSGKGWLEHTCSR